MSAHQLSVAKFGNYFKAIKEYFGLTRNDLFLKQEEVEMNPNLVEDESFRAETEVIIEEHIPYEDILTLFDKSKLDVGEFEPQYASFVWLVANIYYGDSYNFYLEEIGMSDMALDARIYEEVGKENLQLFIALKAYSEARNRVYSKRYKWEEAWMIAHTEERSLRKKRIIKELENDYGEIRGEDWKLKEETYNRIADGRIDKEMGKEMRIEKEWIALNEKLKEAETITINFGKHQKTIAIPNFEFWINKLMENHVFPRFIPEVKTVDDAKALLRKPAGRPLEDIRVRTIAYGLSNYFFDNEVIETRTSRKLLDFLEGLFKMMDIRCNNGKYPDWQKLEDVIQNAPNAKEKPRFYTQDDNRRKRSKKEMKDYVENGLNCKNKSFNYETGNKDTISYVFATEDWPTEHLYYKGSNYSVLKQSIAYTQLLIVLPDENVDINDVNVAEAYQKFMEEKANVRAYGYIPLFHDHSENVNLTELFRSSFDGNEILMDKLLKDDVVNDLLLEQVLQTSDFELNEYGVCGESITAAWSAGATRPQGELIEFNVDKPFYAISLYDNFPLFVNKVNNPGK